MMGKLEPERIQNYVLDFNAKRPLVTFGSLAISNETALSEIETRWLPTFIRSGASAFVSVLWSTPVEIDRLFWQSFYQAIWSKRSLGEAVYHSRQVVKLTYPNSWDWLAYYLVGDPMSVGYIPRPGDGFITLECRNHDMEQPLVLDETYNFVASLRDIPPTWYKNRLTQAPTEEWTNPAIQIFAPEFSIYPGSFIKMDNPVNGIRYARFSLTPRRSEPADIFINYISNQQEVRNCLSFSVEVHPKSRVA